MSPAIAASSAQTPRPSACNCQCSSQYLRDSQSVVADPEGERSKTTDEPSNISAQSSKRPHRQNLSGGRRRRPNTSSTISRPATRESNRRLRQPRGNNEAPKTKRQKTTLCVLSNNKASNRNAHASKNASQNWATMATAFQRILNHTENIKCGML